MTALIGPLNPEALIKEFRGDARLMPQTIVALAEEVTKLKLLAYSHLGDNHHNARDCPYCQGRAPK